MKKYINSIIHETVKKTLNEDVSMTREIYKLQNAVNILQNVYNAIIERWFSKHEVSTLKIEKMIENLKQIQKQWQHTSVW